MAKYIDAEKLKAKIEDLTKQKEKKLEKFSDEDYVCSIASEIYLLKLGNSEILPIIDSLQQEESTEVDLEKEIDRIWENGLSDELEGPHNPFNVYARIARYFYERGLNARK